ncbi:MAG: carboxypeptidase-like regulatory domain-containing protein, partial [Perlabentimonas sp.]
MYPTKKLRNLTALLMLFTLNSIFAFSQNELKQTVRGQIIDADTKIPLIGASIIVEGIDPIMGTTADLNGNFRLERVPVGRHNFKVSYVGYEPFTFAEILVGSGKEVILDIELKESLMALNEVVIRANTNKDQPINSMATLSARTFS